MQRDRLVAARIWLENARVDLAVAAEIAERFPSRACFHAQQAAELALKAALIAVADDHPRTRVADVLVGELVDLGIDVPVDVAEAANRLDLFYMGSRYPDALVGADPLKVLQSACPSGNVCDWQRTTGASIHYGAGASLRCCHVEFVGPLAESAARPSTSCKPARLARRDRRLSAFLAV